MRYECRTKPFSIIYLDAIHYKNQQTINKAKD